MPAEASRLEKYYEESGTAWDTMLFESSPLLGGLDIYGVVADVEPSDLRAHSGDAELFWEKLGILMSDMQEYGIDGFVIGAIDAAAEVREHLDSVRGQRRR